MPKKSAPPASGQWSQLWDLIGKMPMTDKARGRYDTYNELSPDSEERSICFMMWYAENATMPVVPSSVVPTGRLSGDSLSTEIADLKAAHAAEIAALKAAHAAEIAPLKAVRAPDNQKELDHLRSSLATLMKKMESNRRVNGFKTLL